MYRELPHEPIIIKLGPNVPIDVLKEIQNILDPSDVNLDEALKEIINRNYDINIVHIEIGYLFTVRVGERKKWLQFAIELIRNSEPPNLMEISVFYSLYSYVLYSNGFYDRKTAFSCISNSNLFMSLILRDYSIPDKFLPQGIYNFKTIKDVEFQKIISDGTCDPIASIIERDDSEGLVAFSAEKNWKKHRIFVLNAPKNYDLLEYAAQFGAIKCFKFLLLQGFQINKFHVEYAINSGCLEILRLCEQGNEDFTTGLYSACYSHRNEIYDWIDFNHSVQKPSGNYIIDTINIELYENVYKNIFLSSKRLETFGKLELEQRMGEQNFALVCGDMNLIKLYNEFTDSMLQYAVQSRDLDAMKFILGHGAKIDPNSENTKIAVKICCELGIDNILEFLLQNGADPNAPSLVYIPLVTTITFHRINCFKVLLKFNADINSEGIGGSVPISDTIQENNLEAFKLLLDAGARTDVIIEPYRYTLLHLAVIAANAEMVEVLIEKGIDVNSAGNNGMTPLHLACESNDTTMVKDLIERGADLEARDVNGDTPLMRAIMTGFTSGAMALIEAGADIRAKSNDGSDCILNAVDTDNTFLVQELVKRGVNLNPDEEIRPLDVAIERGFKEMCECLVQLGAVSQKYNLKDIHDQWSCAIA